MNVIVVHLFSWQLFLWLGIGTRTSKSQTADRQSCLLNFLFDYFYCRRAFMVVLFEIELNYQKRLVVALMGIFSTSSIALVLVLW